MSKKYPTAKTIKFILCEDLREEPRSKLTLLGVFAADSISILKPEAPKGGTGVAVLSSLAIVVAIKGIAGDFEAALAVHSPNGKKPAFEGKLGKVTLPKLGSATLAWKVQGFVVPKFGKYRAELSLDDRVYPFEFEILDGSMQQAEKAA